MNSKSAKIKNIYIELPGYEYFHSPSGVSRKDKRLIGRKAVKERLQTILKNSKTKAGAYLVTGYRGMGKTSLVRDIIAGIKEDGQKPRPEWVVLEIWFIMILINLFGVQLGHFLDNYIQGGSGFVKEVKNLPMALGFVWFVLGILFYALSQQAKEWANMPNPPMSFFSRFSVTRRQEFFHEWWMWVWPKSSSEQVLAVETSLSQDEIREMDFLRLLTKNLAKVYGDFCKPLFSFLNSLRWVRNILIWALVFLCIYPEIYKYYVTLPIPGWARIILDPTFPLFSFFLFSFLVVGLRGYLSRILCKIGFTTQGEIRDRLQSLISKIDATVTMEQHQQVSPTAAPVNLFQFSRRQTQEFQIAGIKEIEFGLIDILDGIDKIWSPGGYKPKFICVFDELDKIQMDLSPNAANQEMDDDPSLVDRNYPIRRLRERRERISNILANLKHFLNVAKAKFVFIAGREMFDASLADISDRDFFLGSIFHEIIYVESFLKDRINSQSFGLTNMFEHYLCRFLIGYDSAKEEGKQKKGELKEGKLNLKNYYDTFKKGNESKGEINKDLRKAISTLQDFVIFLVYRSNGTPKKITSLFEKYIKEIPLVAEKGKEDKMIPKGSNPNRDIIIKSPKKEAGSSKSFFLYFGHNDQYQFALISYLFRPYLISGSQYMKLFGDKLLFSTAFLVDHLFKFHPWAFSWRTLELTPEIVFASKSPQLRAFIGTLMKSLLRSHIREVVYGVFEFKFYNKTRHEISFISKINEGESAAFNFTLDESKHIKTHFQNRLRKRIQQYKDHPARKEGDYFQSLSFLHATLGDIFFYDQEFDEALLAYSDAVAIYGLDFPRKFSPHQLTNWMKDRLKMALTYERMHSNNDALSIYEGILMDLDTLFGLNTRHGVTKKAQKGQAGFAKALFENLRFFQLPFVAKLVMIEKEGISGISYLDIVQVEKRMRRLLQLCLRANQASTRGVFTPVGRSVESQEYLVRTYYHLNVGAVLYFKNGTVIHAREELRENDEKLWKHLSNYLFSGTGGPATESSSFIAPRSATMEYYKAFLFLIARLQAFSPQRTPLINAKQNPDSSEVEEGAFDWISDLINEKINKLNGKIASKEKEVENLKEEINQLDIKTASNKDKVENLYEAIASIKVENLKEEIASKEKEVE
ncbi:MAG TPA: ATP-binding protein, partial [Bacteroidetes bacterium]|nr:ATP-binding protein [Bacteroidota bacterium]